MGKLVKGKHVFLDLGDCFAAGKVIRLTPYMITLQICRKKRMLRPSYSRTTVHKVIPIHPDISKTLGPLSYPPNPHRTK